MFFNRAFALFALETYFYKVYYLTLVCYICQAYLLKVRPLQSAGKASNPRCNRRRQQVIFGVVVGCLVAVETAILIASIVIEDDNRSSLNCEGK